MSTESAKPFVKKMQDDNGFAREVEKLVSKEERATFIKQRGFDFTKGELMDVVMELNALDVVGGKCCGFTCENDSGCAKEPYCRPV